MYSASSYDGMTVGYLMAELAEYDPELPIEIEGRGTVTEIMINEHSVVILRSEK